MPLCRRNSDEYKNQRIEKSESYWKKPVCKQHGKSYDGDFGNHNPFCRDIVRSSIDSEITGQHHFERYLKENNDLPEDHRKIIQSWKRRVQGRFMMERHLKNGTIFISMEDGEVYQVSGIISSWEEMFFGAPMPLIIEATFMPFRDVIISDGLVMPYNILIGGGMKRMFKDSYMAAKKSGQIHRSL
jgi:hypothetical protein